MIRHKRTRSKTAISNIEQLVSYQYWSDGTLITSGYTQPLLSQPTWNESMTDWVVEGYNNLRSSGAIIMNPCLRTRSRIAQTGSVSTLLKQERTTTYPRPPYSPSNPRTYYLVEVWARPIVMSSVPAHTAFPENVRDAAITGAYAKAQGSVSQLLVTIGELAKTIDLIINLKKRIAENLLKFLRTKGKKKFIRAVDASGNAWLEARYGWRPLVYEVDGLCEAAAKQIHELKSSVYRTQFIAKTVEETTTYGIQHDGYSSHVIHQTVRHHHHAKCVLLYKVSDDFLSRLDRNFGITSILSSAWELVPFSFMIDWVVDIGDYITSWENRGNISVAESCITQRSYTHAEYKDPVTGSRTVGERETISRTINPEIPRLPSFNLNMDIFKGVDTYYILRNALGKVKL